MGTPIGVGVDRLHRRRSVRRSSQGYRTIGEPIGLRIAKNELTIDATVGVAAIAGEEGSTPSSHQILDRGLMGLVRASEVGLRLLCDQSGE